MVEKAGIGSGTPLPPSSIPTAETPKSDTKTDNGVAPLSEYFWQVAKAGAEYLGQAAQFATAQAPEKVKPEEASAYFDRANEEFKRAYKEGGTEEQARVQLDAMQAAVPALMEQAKDPEVAAYLKTFQDVTPEEAAKSYDSMGTIDADSLKRGIGVAPSDPAKAKAAFEVLTRLKALETAKSDYFNKYHKDSQDDLERLAFYKEKKGEQMLKEMGKQLRQDTTSLDSQRLVVAIDENVRDFSSLAKDLDSWKEAADKTADPKAKTGELISLLQRWAQDYGNISTLSGPQIQGKLQGIKDDIVATVRDNPQVLAVDGKAIPAGAERVRSFLEAIFPSGVAIVDRRLLAKLSPEGMTVFAQLQSEAEDAVMSAVKKTAAGDKAGAKEDYLLALGDYAELKDEAATQAIDGKIRDLLGTGSSKLEILQTFGRMMGEVTGSGVSLEARLKEEIGSQDLLKTFLDPALKLTQDAGAKPYAGTTSDLLKVSKDLVQVLKIREEAGIPNDDPGMWTVLDQMKYTMGKVADGSASEKDKLDLREQVVSLDVALMPEVAHSLQTTGNLGGGFLDRVAHPELSGGVSLKIDADYRGQEMLQHLQDWQTAIFQSHLEPKEELDKWAEMSGVLSLYRPLTKAGDPPVIAADKLDALILPISQSVEALAPKLVVQQFPDLAKQPGLLTQLGSDLAKLSSDAMAKGEPQFAAVLRDPKALSAFVGMTLKARELEGKAQGIESDLEKLKDTAPNYAGKKAEALQLHMKAAELYAQRGGPVERVRETLKPAMDFYEGITGDPDLSAADRAEGSLDLAKLYQGLGLKEDAGALYDKVLGLDRDQQATGKEDARLSTAATMAKGEKALLKEPPDYDAAKAFFHSLPGVEEAQQRYDAITALQRLQRLPKVVEALQAVADEYAAKLEQRDGKEEADQFRAEFAGRAAMFQEKLQTGNYRTVEELFQDFGYVHYDPLQGYDDLKWFTGKNDSMDWQEFNRKSLALLSAATNPEAGDKEFAELGLDMGEYLGSAGDLDFWDLRASDVDYFAASGQILDMMSQDQYVGARAKYYRDDIPNRVVKNFIGKEFGNLTVVGAENLNEAAKSAALWLVPLGVGRLAGTGARFLGAGERLAMAANMIATPLSQILVESAWTGNWDAFSAKGLATTGITTFVSFFGYKYISRLSQGLEEVAMRSETAGMRIAGQAAVKPAFRVLMKMGEFSAGGLFEAGSAFAEEAVGLKEVDPRQKGASVWWRAFERFSVGGAANLQMHLGEHITGGILEAATGGKLTAAEQKFSLQDRLPEMQEAAKSLGWDLDFPSAQAWIEQQRRPSPEKPGEQQLAALMAMDPKQLKTLAKDPALASEARDVVKKLYPDLDPNSWEAQRQAFGVMDYFGHARDKGVSKQFEEFQKTAESLGFKTSKELGAYYELAQAGMTPTQAKKYAEELLEDSEYKAKVDLLVDAYYLKPGAKIDAELRGQLRGDVALTLFEESVKTGKSPKNLLASHAEETGAEKKTAGLEPGTLQKSYSGPPVEEWLAGLAKWFGYESKAAKKEKGWKALDAWVESEPRTSPKSGLALSDGTKAAVGKWVRAEPSSVDSFLDQTGIQHPGLREKITKSLSKLGLSPEQITAWNAKAPELGKSLKKISETILGSEGLDTASGQLLAAELLSRTMLAGGNGKNPDAGLSYLQDVGRWGQSYRLFLERVAKEILGHPDSVSESSGRVLRAALFLKAVSGAENSGDLGARLEAWSNPALWGRVGEILLETEGNGVSTPGGRKRIAKKILEILGTTESPEAVLRSLVPAESSPAKVIQGVVSVEQVDGVSRTQFAQIKLKDGKARIFPKTGYAVEVLDEATGRWVPAESAQGITSGTWFRQPGSPYGQKLFVMRTDGKVFLQDYATVVGRIREAGEALGSLKFQAPEWFQGPKDSVRDYLKRVEMSPTLDVTGEAKQVLEVLQTLEPAVKTVPMRMQETIRAALLEKVLSGRLSMEEAREISDRVQKEQAALPKPGISSVEDVASEDRLESFGLEDATDVFTESDANTEDENSQYEDFLAALKAQTIETAGPSNVASLPLPRSKKTTKEIPEMRAAARLEKSGEHSEFAPPAGSAEIPGDAAGPSPAAEPNRSAVKVSDLALGKDVQETLAEAKDLLFEVLGSKRKLLQKIDQEIGAISADIQGRVQSEEQTKREYFEREFPALARFYEALPVLEEKLEFWQRPRNPAEFDRGVSLLKAETKKLEAFVADFRDLQELKGVILEINSVFLGMELRGRSQAGSGEDLRVSRIKIPDWVDSVKFEFQFLEDRLRIREGKASELSQAKIKIELGEGESAEKAKEVLTKMAETLGLRVEDRGATALLHTSGGSLLRLEIDLAAETPEPRAAAWVDKKESPTEGKGVSSAPLLPVMLNSQSEKIPLGPESYLQKVGGIWIFKNPGKETWYLGADQRGVLTGEPSIRDGDVLVPFEGPPVLVQDPVLRAKPAFQVGKEIEPLDLPQGALGNISLPMDMSIHGIKVRGYAKDPAAPDNRTYEVRYHTRPGEKLMVRRGEDLMEIRSTTGGNYDPKKPARMELQHGDVLEIHTVQVGKKNPLASFTFDSYGALLREPKVVAKKPVLAGISNEAEELPSVSLGERAEVQAQEPSEAPPTEKMGLLGSWAMGPGKIALSLSPYAALLPIFVEAIHAHGLLGGGMHLAAGGLWGKIKGFVGLGKTEAVPQVEPALPVVGRVTLKPQRPLDGGGEAVTIGGELDRSADGKIKGQVTIPGLPKGIKVEYQHELGVSKLSAAGGQPFECTVRLKGDGFKEKKVTLSGEIEFEDGDQILLPHPGGAVTITLREGKKDYALESTQPFVDLGLDAYSGAAGGVGSLPRGAPMPGPEPLAAARLSSGELTAVARGNLFGDADPLKAAVLIRIKESKTIKGSSGKTVGEASIIAGGESGTSQMTFQDGSYVSAQTSLGGRSYQEDSTYLGRFSLADGTEVKIIAGSDGAGGAGGGDVASSAFLQGVHAQAAKAIGEGRAPTADELFKSGMLALNEQKKHAGPRAKRATGTGAIVVIVGDTAMIATAGDAMVAHSRRLPNGDYQTLGYTHIDNAASNIITNSVSANMPNLYVVKGLQPGDRFTIASDGGWENLLGVQYKKKGSTLMRGNGPTPDQETFRALNEFNSATYGTEGAGEVFHDLALGNLRDPGQKISIGGREVQLPEDADSDNIFAISYEQGNGTSKANGEVPAQYRDLEYVPCPEAPETIKLPKLDPVKPGESPGDAEEENEWIYGSENLPTGRYQGEPAPLPTVKATALGASEGKASASKSTAKSAAGAVTKSAEIDWLKVDAKGQDFYFRYEGGKFLPSPSEEAPGSVVVSVKKVVKQGKEIYEVTTKGMPKGVTFFLNFEGKNVPLSGYFKTHLAPKSSAS